MTDQTSTGDFDVLADAFAELEDRADRSLTTQRAAPAPHRSRRPHLLLVAASVLGVLALTAGIAVLADDNHPSAQAGGSPLSSEPTSSPATSTPGSSTAISGSPTSSPPVSSAGSSGSATSVGASRVPGNAADLARRFRVVLAGSSTPDASFTVTDTDPNGNAIVGVLTARGHSGGFDLQIFAAKPGSAASCDDPGTPCTVRQRPDGSSLAVGTEPLQGSANGVTHQVGLVRTDGTEYLMHVSNEKDPKGASDVLSPTPPLTTDEMVALLASERW